MGILEEILQKVEALGEKIESLESREPERKGVYTAEEAAEYLKVSQRTIYNLINAGELERVKIGSRKVIPGKVLDEYIEENVSREDRPYQNNITKVGG